MNCPCSSLVIRKKNSLNNYIISKHRKANWTLGVPELISGTRENQAIAVYKALDNWDLIENVPTVCCNTTASNIC